MKKILPVLVALALLAGCGGKTPPVPEPTPIQTEQGERELQQLAGEALALWRQMGGAPVFSADTMNSAAAARLFMQYCIATGQEPPYSDQTEHWLTAAPVDEFVMTYFGLAPEVLRERDTEAAESKLYDPEHGYIAPVNLSAAPQEVELRSAQWADAETFTLLLEYRYSPADGDGAAARDVKDAFPPGACAFCPALLQRDDNIDFRRLFFDNERTESIK